MTDRWKQRRPPAIQRARGDCAGKEPSILGSHRISRLCLFGPWLGARICKSPACPSQDPKISVPVESTICAPFGYYRNLRALLRSVLHMETDRKLGLRGG